MAASYMLDHVAHTKFHQNTLSEIKNGVKFNIINIMTLHFCFELHHGNLQSGQAKTDSIMVFLFPWV